MEPMKKAIFKEYWLKKLSGELPKISLPFIHHTREKNEKTNLTHQPAVSISMEIPTAISIQLKKAARNSDYALFILFLSGLNILLTKYTGINDLIVGTIPPAAKENDNIIFCRSVVPGDMTVKELILKTKDMMLAAIKYSHYSLDDMVEALRIKNNINHLDIFNVAILYEPFQARNKYLEQFGLIVIFSPVNEGFCLHLRIPFSSSSSHEVSRNLGQNLIAALSRMLENPVQKISHLEILNHEEKNRLLYEFNSTGADYPRETSLQQLFVQQADKAPDRIAIVGIGQFAGDRKGKNKETVQLTYQELNKKSDKLAVLLLKKGIKPETVAALILGRSVEIMVGIYGILKAGGAYLPIDPGYPEERINYMLKDSGAEIIITDSSSSSSWLSLGAHVILNLSEGHHFDFPCSTSPSMSSSHCFPPSALAYVIYTSGSTGKPRGILIRHGNVVNFIKGITSRIAFEAGKSILALTTISFDIFVLETLLPLTRGLKVIIANRQQQLDPGLLKNLVNNNHIEMVQVTPSRLRFMLEVPGCLWGVKVLMVGGETFAGSLLRRLQKGFKGQVYNLYGPTETTVWSTLKDLTSAGTEEITIGGPISNTRVYILDRNQRLQPIGAVGELGIGGDGVARGYLNNPGLTAERFIELEVKEDVYNNSFRSYPSYIIYRTGDLARWLPNGEIHFLGRMDHQVKIRGFRIEPGEIEKRLLEHESVKEAVVTAREEGNREKYLCAYVVPSSPGSTLLSGILKEHLSDRLPDYMVPSYYVTLEKMPLTPNGKVNPKALPEPEFTTGQTYTAPANEKEKKIVDIWTEILGRDQLSAPKIGIDDNFFHLGGHSLNAVLMIGQLQKEFNIDIPLAKMFKMPTIRDLSSYISQNEESAYSEIQPTEKKEYYPLSSAQHRMFLVQQMEPDNTVYNLFFAVRLEGVVRPDKFKDTFKQLVSRHESLRTSFEIIEGEPVQKVYDQVEFEIQFNDLQENPGTVNHNKDSHARNMKANKSCPLILHGAEGKSNFIRSFDLSQAPLLRLGLIKKEREKHLLLVDMHHIISDGISINLLIKEFAAIYSGQPLSVPVIQYKDFARWQNKQLGSEQTKQQQDFWLKEFQEGAGITVLNLPIDYPRPAIQNFEGNGIHFEMGNRETQKIKKITSQETVTLFMFLLSVFYVLLMKLSGQEDIIIGTPTAGRRNPGTHQVIGMFVNTLALRNHPVGHKTFKQFLGEVKEQTLKALDNQDYTFEQLIQLMTIERDTGRNPVFDVMFTLDNPGQVSQNPEELNIPGLKIKPYVSYNKVSKFDLTLVVVDGKENITFSFEYCTRLFKQKTIERMSVYFRNIVQKVIKDPAVKISEVEMISPGEKRQILNEFNDTAAVYPTDKTVHDLLFQQVSKTGKHIAVVFGDQQVTYDQLDKKTSQMASILRSRGTKVGSIIGIMVDRSIEMVVGMIAVLKAGGAYLPIEPHLPEVRQRYMIEDSGVSHILAQSPFVHFPRSNCKVIDLQEAAGPGKPNQNLANINTTGDLMYLIYTSGSTGNPKGVMIEHGSFINRLYWLQDRFQFDGSDVILQKTAFSFDVSVCEVFRGMTGGAKLVLMETGAEKDPESIIKITDKEHITVIEFVPSMLEVFLDYIDTPERLVCLKSLKWVFVGAEVLSPILVDRFNALFKGKYNTQLINAYGPTEATVDITCFDCSGIEGHEKIPIGKPMANSQVYILEKGSNLQVIGAAGELWVSGKPLARGYLNSPELTAEKFPAIVNQELLRGVVPKAQSAGRKANNTINAMRKAPCAMRIPPGRRKQRVYKTGDLARWLSDGNIEFLGRIDYQVKIRGYRIQLEEIENALLRYKGIKQAAAAVKKDEKGSKYLCAYITAHHADKVELNRYLLDTLPHYMVPSHLVLLDRIPLLPGGKVDRKALPGVKAGELLEQYTAPCNFTEKKLAEIWADLLATHWSLISTTANFFHLGGHSLKAAAMVGKIQKVFKVKIPLPVIFKSSTLKELAETIAKKTTNTLIKIEPTPLKRHYPLSCAQKRLYFLSHMEGIGTAYNLPIAMMLEGKLNRDAFKKALQELVKRHESLRTTFKQENGVPVQVIHGHTDFNLFSGQTHDEAGNKEIDTMIADFIKPFDLAVLPLVRMKLVSLSKEKHLLLFDMHHIISDGVSSAVIVKEFISLYQGQQLPPLPLQYKDFAHWQHQVLQSGKLKQQETFWLNCFAGPLPRLKLPLDFQRPKQQCFAGDTTNVLLEENIAKQLHVMAFNTGTTLFMLLLAVFNVLLAKYTGQEDILVGVPVSGRTHPDLQNVIGMFVNTLPIRSRPKKSDTFNTFLNQVKTHLPEAYENQDYPFEELVDHMNIPRDTGRNPLVDILFVSQNMDIPGLTLQGLKFTPYHYKNQISHLDLVLYFTEIGNNINFTMEYSTALFKPETAQQMLDHYIEILEQVLEDREIALKDIVISHNYLMVRSPTLTQEGTKFDF